MPARERRWASQPMASEGNMKARIAVTAGFIALAAAMPAMAADPVGADQFNIKTDLDLKSLTTANFYDVLVPAAQGQKSIVFYDFGESEKELFAEIISRFEKKYGVTVE